MMKLTSSAQVFTNTRVLIQGLKRGKNILITVKNRIPFAFVWPS